MNHQKYFSSIGSDFPASVVVFFVALPLCLGIALASGAPLFSGLLAGIIGGIVVGSLSGSHVSVSGPAAGLTVIVLSAITELGSFEVFLAAVVMAGLLQLLLGFFKAGVIGYYFPTSVIRGMLAAIGLILIIKQIPYALGTQHAQPDEDSHVVLSQDLFGFWDDISLSSVLIFVISFATILLFERPFIKKQPLLAHLPGALVAVFVGSILNALISIAWPEFAIHGDLLVQIPITDSFADIIGLMTHPDFSQISTQQFWMVAVTLAMVGSIETLLSIEAADKLDPERRITPASRELVAQGVGNTLSGLVGGLPITAVIVRSSANVNAGAKTKLSAILHGLLLMVLVLSIPGLLNMIPFACLAAVLFQVGFKLTSPKIIKEIYAKGLDQFLPFIITIIAIVAFDLLIGICVGMIVGFIFVIKSNFHSAITFTEHNGNILIRFHKDVSFLNKAILLDHLSRVPDGAKVLINCQRTRFIDQDIKDVLLDFQENAHHKDISLSFEGFNEQLEFSS